MTGPAYPVEQVPKNSAALRSTVSAALRQPSLLPETASPKQAFRNIRNYLAGQFVGATRDDTLLDEVLKCLFCKLLLEAEALELASGKVELARQVRALFAKVRLRFREIYPKDEEILLDPDA